VFLNNSIEPVTAGLECQTPACIQKFPPTTICKTFIIPQTARIRKTIQATTNRNLPKNTRKTEGDAIISGRIWWRAPRPLRFRGVRQTI